MSDGESPLYCSSGRWILCLVQQNFLADFSPIGLKATTMLHGMSAYSMAVQYLSRATHGSSAKLLFRCPYCMCDKDCTSVS